MYSLPSKPAFSPVRLVPLLQDLMGNNPARQNKLKSSTASEAAKRGYALNGAELPMMRQNGHVISVRISVRASARRLILRVDRRTGQPRLTIPPRIAQRRVEAFLEEHRSWLETRLNNQPQTKRFIAGAEIPIRGVMHKICHIPPFRGETRLGMVEGLPCLFVHGDEAHVPTRVLRFLKAEALRDIGEAVTRHAEKLGVEIGTITIKDTRSRWGSCAARGNLAFSWRLILAPPFVLDYLAAHEVAHRREMNHSPRYWQHVETLLPDYQRAECWLKQHGLNLHLYQP